MIAVLPGTPGLFPRRAGNHPDRPNESHRRSPARAQLGGAWPSETSAACPWLGSAGSPWMPRPGCISLGDAVAPCSSRLSRGWP